MGEPQYRLEGIVHTKSDVLEDFEGPLDVIFELLSKNKIEIQDVSISAILEQYLGYLDEMKRMDMEIASEFITMASHLMLIKTKMLLSAAEQAEAESELDLLRQSLVERKRKEAMEQIRQAVAVLEPRNEIGRCLFTKEPEPLRREQGYRYQHDVIDLLRALDIIAERSQRQLPPPTANFRGIVGKEPYPIGRKTGEVLRQLLLRGVERLKNLFRGSRSRSEVVATFLAILDLCKTNSVTLEDDPGGENPNVRLLDKHPREEMTCWNRNSYSVPLRPFSLPRASGSISEDSPPRWKRTRRMWKRLPTIWRINMPLSAGEFVFSSWKRATRWCPPGKWRTM